ncbi:YceG-like family protein [Bacteroidales bacterium Barb7]|nr:YceG-like family protein [Bacteroidales bacterium Barb7]
MLQADPTVKYAAGDFMLKRILFTHLKIDSPYNTYLYPGLPPAPLRIPTIKGLDGVLDHAKHNYIYMVAKEDFSGRHNFAVTLSEHNRNANRYRAELNRRHIR